MSDDDFPPLPPATSALETNGSVRFVLPYPPGANHYKMPRALPKGGVMFYLTKEAKAFREVVGWTARSVGCRKPTSRPVEVALSLRPRANKGGEASLVVLDVGNVEKVALDAMQGVVYENDKQIKRLVVEYGEPVDRGGLVVEVRLFVAPPGGLFAD